MKMKSSLNLSIDTKLKEKAREKGLNISQLVEETLAKELDTGRELERLIEKREKHLRIVEVYDEQIKECKRIMKSKKKQNEELKPRQEEAVRVCLESMDRHDGTLLDDVVKHQAKTCGLSISELEALVDREVEK